MTSEKIHFVTGRLAAHWLRKILGELSRSANFDYTIDVLNITVAALMTTDWVAQRVEIPADTDRVILPGYCRGDLEALRPIAGAAKIERGPHDLRRLPNYFSREPLADDYGKYSIEIIAEINHAPQLAHNQILTEAKRLAKDGANVIDLGCNPGERWLQVGDVVRMLRDEGLRVSVDSLDCDEITMAVAAGAELVLSINSSNRHIAADLGCEVVVIPDDPQSLESMYETIEYLAERGIPMRLDPVLSPIGFGFSESLGRYLEIRRRYADAEMMMGIGNLTELTDVDSAGLNVLLLGFCQEQRISSVLTTEVIGWARSSVKECDAARKLVHYADYHRCLPKRLNSDLIMLRDAEVSSIEEDEIDRLAQDIKDNNYRLFVCEGEIHLVSAKLHLKGRDPFELFAKLLEQRGEASINASHAFYLGYEISKAVTALTLDKNYQQDEALDWGILTETEKYHRLSTKQKRT